MTVLEYLEKYGTQGTSIAVLGALRILNNPVSSAGAKEKAIEIVSEIMWDLIEALQSLK